MRAVKQAHATPFTSTAYFVALMLVLFSASGLLAGVLTKQVASALRPNTGNTSTLPPAALTATAGAVTPAATGFDLQLTVTPNPVKAGQSLQIVVTTTATQTTDPLPGVLCSLVQNGNSLPLATWPPTQTTDSSGRAQWSVEVPPTITGQYTVYARGDGAHGYWKTHWVTLTVTQ